MEGWRGGRELVRFLCSAEGLLRSPAFVGRVDRRRRDVEEEHCHGYGREYIVGSAYY